jgi:RHS repeat-associated protein
MTYDASGNLLCRKTFTTNSTVPSETRDYIGNIEYVNNVIDQVHHEQGRYKSISAGVFRHEYTIADHLGSTRIVYTDVNNNGLVDQTTDILDENHYYAYGMELPGTFINVAGTNYNYKFNGIERAESYVMDFAFYRGLDPILGRWYQIDPRAEEAGFGMSPYCGMNNNPITYADPEGDIAPLVVIGAAVIGGGINVWRNWDKVKSEGWGAGLKAFGIGAVAGTVGVLAAPAAAVGSTVAATVTSYAVSGAVAGGVSGLITGYGNSAVFHRHRNLEDHIKNGLIEGAVGFVSGAITGAIVGRAAHWWTHRSIKGPTLVKEPPSATIEADGPNVVKTGDTPEGFAVKSDGYTITSNREGTFSISDWGDYPEGLAKPRGPFRLVVGEEYKKARALADFTNKNLRKANPAFFEGLEIHEIQPVKFGGSPTDLANKIYLPKNYHRGIVSPWWKILQNKLEKIR